MCNDTVITTVSNLIAEICALDLRKQCSSDYGAFFCLLFYILYMHGELTGDVHTTTWMQMVCTLDC